MKLIGLILIITLMASCSMNKFFLKPTKFPVTTSKCTIIDYDSKDTTLIRFIGNNFQPQFFDIRNVPLKMKYTIKSLCFKNSNGLLLNGWLIRPVENKKITTTILHFHGNEGSIISQYQAIIPLVKNDVQVFMFDYCGYGFSEGKATLDNVLSDSFSALDYIQTREEIKETKIIFYGQSLGGHVAAVVAAKKQNQIAGLVTEGAFSSIKDIAAYKVNKSIGLGFIGRILAKSNYSAKESIKEFHKPVLIIHSKEDAVIPFYMAQTLYASANQPKFLYEIKGEHIFGAIKYTDSILSKINQLIK